MAADLDLVRRLVAAERGLAVLATTRTDGSVHASVVNGGVLNSPLGGAPVVGTVILGKAWKLKRIRRTGLATITFRVGFEWATVDGPVTIIGPDDPHPGVPPEAVPGLLRDIFTACGGTHDDWDEYDRVMAAERRAAVLIDPVRVIGN